MHLEQDAAQRLEYENYADGLEGADAAEAVDAALPGTTEDADEAAEAAGAEAVSEDELLESGDDEDDVQACLENMSDGAQGAAPQLRYWPGSSSKWAGNLTASLSAWLQGLSAMET